jgi:hypothetical protein
MVGRIEQTELFCNEVRRKREKGLEEGRPIRERPMGDEGSGEGVTPVHPGEEKELERVGENISDENTIRQNNDQAYGKFR